MKLPEQVKRNRAKQKLDKLSPESRQKVANALATFFSLQAKPKANSAPEKKD